MKRPEVIDLAMLADEFVTKAHPILESLMQQSGFNFSKCALDQEARTRISSIIAIELTKRNCETLAICNSF
ncbi:hypothetical protein [Burkholderia sp. BE17]|uniref:hypothetical protein n=1 Tax=Burkholderia sp. BE17 TaxID=2656644 RepID=UPI00128AEBD3|nr:hypothetical protein [Burkholderia sp. BE17]MPV66320.1 hypothetical protein [Burkholderia sp. BE17]